MRLSLSFLLFLLLGSLAAEAQQITSVTPGSARRRQTLEVTITGQDTRFGFVQGSPTVGNSVWLSKAGQSPVYLTIVEISSESMIRAALTLYEQYPVAGAWDVNVSYPVSAHTTNTVTLPGGFTIEEASLPYILSVADGGGNLGSSLTVTITGAWTTFSSGPEEVERVWLATGSRRIDATNIQVQSPTVLNATFAIPSSSDYLGTYNVMIEQPRGLGVVIGTGGVVVSPASEIASITPNVAKPGDMVRTLITGSNSHFSIYRGAQMDARTVKLRSGTSSIAGTSIVNMGKTFLQADFQIPWGLPAGFWDVYIEQPDGRGNLTLVNGFEIRPAEASIIELTPVTAQRGRSVELTIVGLNTHFQDGALVARRVWLSRGSMEEDAASFQVVDPTTLRATFELKNHMEPGQWDLRVTQAGSFGDVVLPGGFTVTLLPAGVGAGRTLSGVSLGNHPNPAGASTIFTLKLDKPSQTRLTIFTPEGKELATLFDGRYPSGTHTVDYSTRGLAAGVYLYRLVTPGGTISRQMIVVR